MNGFANTVLTMLLSWMRALVNSLWRMMSSEDGGVMYQFLAANWKAIVLVLCVGGFVADRVVYLIRWRPYYVWSTKLNRLRRARKAGEAEEPALPEDEDAYAGPEPPSEPASAPTQASPYAPPAPGPLYGPSVGTQTFVPPAAGFAPIPAEQPAAPVPTPEMERAAVHYAPLAQTLGEDHVPYARPYVPPQDLEPVFDEPEDIWDNGDALVKPLAWENPAEGMDSSFGAPKPEPLAYLRDLQAGFARPKPPEQLYAPPAMPKAPEPLPVVKAPVHPGLDEAAFRERFGLTPAPPLTGRPINDAESAGPDGERYDEAAETEAVMHAPAFQPFTSRGDAAPAKGGGPLKRLAKKARDLVGVEDEDHRPTIHDLQSTVDVTRAFHEPVYPKPRDRQGGEE